VLRASLTCSIALAVAKKAARGRTYLVDMHHTIATTWILPALSLMTGYERKLAIYTVQATIRKADEPFAGQQGGLACWAHGAFSCNRQLPVLVARLAFRGNYISASTLGSLLPRHNVFCGEQGGSL